MQTCPPKYQGLVRLRPEKRVPAPLDHDPIDHEEDQPVPALRAKTSYAKDCIPLEKNCNVTEVTEERSCGGGASPRPDEAKPRHHTRHLFVPQRLGRQNPCR